MKILALDYGKRRIGLATGDTRFCIAFDQGFLDQEKEKDVLKTLLNFCEKHGIEKIIIGFPVSENKTESSLEKEILSFGERLKEKSAFSLEFYNEHSTTKQAQQKMKYLKKNIRSQKGIDDALAAQTILERYFEDINKKNVKLGYKFKIKNLE